MPGTFYFMPGTFIKSQKKIPGKLSWDKYFLGTSAACRPKNSWVHSFAPFNYSKFAFSITYLIFNVLIKV
jgi:hypothetical protein